MKEIIAICLSVFYALFNNVDYQSTNTNEFVPGEYYTIEDNFTPDYRELYESGITSASLSSRCNPKSTEVLSKTLIPSSQSTVKTYWIESETFISEEIGVEKLISDQMCYTFSDPIRIVMPLDGRVVTHSDASDNGHYIELAVAEDAYKLVFTNLGYWYCCRGLVSSNAENLLDTAFEHCTDHYGTSLQAGQLVGYAVEGTTFQVQKYNDAAQRYETISIADFYNR